jgi:L-2-hydroxyglutarate oxidase LhgO
MMQKRVCDFLVVGGGVIGLTSAKALAAKYPDSSIMLIEKES